MDMRLKYGLTARNPDGRCPDCVSELIAAVRPDATGSLVRLAPGKCVVRIFLQADVTYSNLSGRRWSQHNGIDIADQFEADVVNKLDSSAVERYEMLHDNVKSEFRLGIEPKLGKDETVPVGAEQDVLKYWCALRDMFVQHGFMRRRAEIVEEDAGFVVENPLKPLSATEHQEAVEAKLYLERIIKIKWPDGEQIRNVGVAVSDDPRMFRLVIGGEPLTKFALFLGGMAFDEKNLKGWSTTKEMVDYFKEQVAIFERVRLPLDLEETFVVENPWSDPRSPI